MRKLSLCSGGVHVQPWNLWRWDDESQRIKPA